MQRNAVEVLVPAEDDTVPARGLALYAVASAVMLS